MEDNINFQKLEKKLIELYGKINTIEEIEKHRGTKFNIFSILGMERKEVNTHSYFLYELLNPNGTHFQGNTYLKIFIEKVLEIKDFEFKNLKVGRETLTDTSRRIDFTIENDKYYIAIEMKIDAGDQDKQLSDYHKFAKSKKESIDLYYLTLDGKEASEESHCGVEYKSISFSNHILKFIEYSIEKSANLPIIRESLIQYKYLIEKITNQSSEEMKMEIVKMIDTPQIAQSATEMSKNLTYVWALKEVEFWKVLADKLNNYLEENQYCEAGWCEVTYNEIFCNDDDEIIESNEEIAEKISKLIYQSDEVFICLEKNDFNFYISARRNDYLHFYIDGTGDIDSIGKKVGITKKAKEGNWINTNHNISFSTMYNPTYDIFDEKRFDEIIESIYDEIVDYLKKITQFL